MHVHELAISHSYTNKYAFVKAKDTMSSAHAVILAHSLLRYPGSTHSDSLSPTAARLPVHCVSPKRNEGPIIPDDVNTVHDIWGQNVGLSQPWHTASEGTTHRGRAGVRGDCVFPPAGSPSHIDSACEHL